MAEIKLTSYSHNAKASLHYLFYSKDNKFNQAHQNKNNIHNRNQYIDGINIIVSKNKNAYKNAVKIYKYYLHQKPNHKIQAINSVISFSPKDINFTNSDGSKNYQDIYIADKLASAWTKKSFGQNRISLLFFQNDNHNKISHIHVCTLPLSIKPSDHLKALSGQQLNIYRLRKIGNQIENNWNIQHPNHQLTSIMCIHYHNQRRRQLNKPIKAPVIEAKLIKSIKPALFQSTSRSQLRHKLANIGITMKTPRKKNGQQHRGILFKSSYSNGFISCSNLAHFDPIFRYGMSKQFKINRKFDRKRDLMQNDKSKFPNFKHKNSTYRMKNNSGHSGHRSIKNNNKTTATNQNHHLRHSSFNLNNSRLWYSYLYSRKHKHTYNANDDISNITDINELRDIINNTSDNSPRHKQAILQLRKILRNLHQNMTRQ